MGGREGSLSQQPHLSCLGTRTWPRLTASEDQLLTCHLFVCALLLCSVPQMPTSDRDLPLIVLGARGPGQRHWSKMPPSWGLGKPILWL